MRLRWCRFELRTASIVKNDHCLWDLSLHEEGTAIDWRGCHDDLQSTRPALTSPEQMATELRDGVASGEIGFTSGADAEVVIDLYAKARPGMVDIAAAIIEGDNGASDRLTRAALDDGE